MRALIAATIMILMVAGSTATSPLFVIYREQWGITSADIAIVFGPIRIVWASGSVHNEVPVATG